MLGEFFVYCQLKFFFSWLGMVMIVKTSFWLFSPFKLQYRLSFFVRLEIKTIFDKMKYLFLKRTIMKWFNFIESIQKNCFQFKILKLLKFALNKKNSTNSYQRCFKKLYSNSSLKNKTAIEITFQDETSFELFFSKHL